MALGGVEGGLKSVGAGQFTQPVEILRDLRPRVG